jgi:putative methionine-R-sulfoxide reductase with GAF domain
MKSFSFNRLNLSQQFLIVAMGTISIILIGVSTYMINTSISAKNDQLQIMTNGRSGGVIEKIDRNFYERFGDVQAFAYNKLAVETASTDAPKSEDVQKFINTMVSYYVLYDLMMICNIDGKVMAVNTQDTGGKKINTDFLIGKNFAAEEWFKKCVAATGPEGGAWYSDFMEDKDVSSIYGRTGWGMAFAAPIKNAEGSPIGVWYNFANWQLVTTDIRKETENVIKQSHPGSFILLTNSEDVVIDSDDPKMLLNTKISIDGLKNVEEFEYEGNKINIRNYVVGGKKGSGAYTYKGKNWNAITFIPLTKFSLSYLIENLLGFLSVIIVLLFIVIIIFYKLASAISKNISSLKNDVESLAKGELVQVKETKLQNEIGAMTVAVKSLVTGMNSTSQFAKQIGEGNLSIQFYALSEKDVLGHSLITMRDNLLRIKEEEQRRSWSTNGLAKIGEILRTNFTSSSELHDSIISFVVKYTHSNQGGLFLLNEDNGESSLTLVACHAYERKKFLERRIAIGEGLVGQCVLEREVIYMTSVPTNYTHITSGLGGATPAAILLVPLKVNESIVGVLELASLEPYEQHERELLQKFAESIASTISTVRINDRTKQLLEQSQQQAEEMKSQEEEMRQNMEELSATQEEMVRKEQEYLRRIEELEMANVK